MGEIPGMPSDSLDKFYWWIMALDGIAFDISDDNQFRTYVVSQLATLGERTAGFPDVEKGLTILTEKLADYHEVKEEVGKIAVLELEVADVRETMKSDKKWGRIQATVGPVMVVIHGFLHRFGIF